MLREETTLFRSANERTNERTFGLVLIGLTFYSGELGVRYSCVIERLGRASLFHVLQQNSEVLSPNLIFNDVYRHIIRILFLFFSLTGR